MHKCRGYMYGPVQLNLCPFYHLTFKSELDLQPTWNNVSKQLCQIILKSMHGYTSNGPDKLNLWPFYHLKFKCELDLKSTWPNVLNEQLCQTILKSMHKCSSYGTDMLNLWPFYNLTFKCDLDLQPTCTKVSNGTSTPQGKHLCHINFKSVHECGSYGQDRLNVWPFYNLTFKCDRDLQLTWTDVSTGTSTPQGEQLCEVNLKSIYKCRSYGPEKLNLWPFRHLTFKCGLDLQTIWINISMTLLLLMENNWPDFFFLNHCINVEIMARTSLI